MGSCRKAAGESGNAEGRGQGAVGRKELSKGPDDETGGWGLEGLGHAARGVDGRSCLPHRSLLDTAPAGRGS